MFKQTVTLFFIFFFANAIGQNLALKQELKALLDKKNDSTYLTVFLNKINDKSTNAIDKVEYQSAYINLCVALAKYNKAMEFSKQNLAIYERENMPYGKTVLTNSVGMCYYYLANKKMALANFSKAYEYAKAYNFIETQALLANNLGAISIEADNYPLAEKYLVESRSLMQKNEEKLNNYGGITLRLLGQVYEHNNNLKRAEEIYDEVDKRLTQLKDSSGLAMNYGCLSRIYMKTKREAKALELNKLSLQCAEALGKRDIRIATRQMYIENLVKAGNYKDALDFQKQIDTLSQMYFSQEVSSKLSEAEIKYKTATLQFENEKIATKNKQQRLLFAIVFITILIVGAVFITAKTKQIKAQQKLDYEKQKANIIITAEEKERIRIARELHDGVGQTMAAASMNLQALKEKITDENAKIIFSKTNQLLNSSIDEVRQLSHTMVSSTLLHAGLVDAINDFINKLVLPDSISISTQLTNYTTKQPIEIESSLLRIIQESVTNSIKHAKASSIKIELSNNTKNEILLKIIDDGNGFDQMNLSKSAGIGIHNIEARTQALNGKLQIETEEKIGTSITVQIPLT
jgi:two-component system, NarL family, sensor kinase